MRAIRGAAIIAAAAVITLGAAGCGGGGVPSTVHGTVTGSAAAAGLEYGSNASCDVTLPGPGTQILLKGDGVTVAAAQLGPDKTGKSNLGIGTCWENFTFTGVPGGKTLYAVTISGCTGAAYYKPAQLSSGAISVSCG